MADTTGKRAALLNGRQAVSPAASDTGIAITAVTAGAVVTAETFRDLLAAPLEKGFSGRFSALVIGNGLCREAIRLASDPDPRVAFRASAALEYAYFADPGQLQPYLEEFLANYLTVTNPSAHRHYTKILESLMRSGRLALSPDQQQQVAEVAFDRLIGERVRPAVKVWSMEILCRLAESLPWVDEQLEESVRHLMSGGSPALCAHGAHICKKIKARRGKF